MFSRLRHVQLLVMLFSQDNDQLLCLLSFLRVAPVIEKLEVHVSDLLGHLALFLGVSIKFEFTGMRKSWCLSLLRHGSMIISP